MHCIYYWMTMANMNIGLSHAKSFVHPMRMKFTESQLNGVWRMREPPAGLCTATATASQIDSHCGSNTHWIEVKKKKRGRFIWCYLLYSANVCQSMSGKFMVPEALHHTHTHTHAFYPSKHFDSEHNELIIQFKLFVRKWMKRKQSNVVEISCIFCFYSKTEHNNKAKKNLDVSVYGKWANDKLKYTYFLFFTCRNKW